jgi:hypothetical protein
MIMKDKAMSRYQQVRELRIAIYREAAERASWW